MGLPPLQPKAPGQPAVTPRPETGGTSSSTKPDISGATGYYLAVNGADLEILRAEKGMAALLIGARKIKNLAKEPDKVRIRHKYREKLAQHLETLIKSNWGDIKTVQHHGYQKQVGRLSEGELALREEIRRTKKSKADTPRQEKLLAIKSILSQYLSDSESRTSKGDQRVLDTMRADQSRRLKGIAQTANTTNAPDPIQQKEIYALKDLGILTELNESKYFSELSAAINTIPDQNEPGASDSETKTIKQYFRRHDLSKHSRKSFLNSIRNRLMIRSLLLITEEEINAENEKFIAPMVYKIKQATLENPITVSLIGLGTTGLILIGASNLDFKSNDSSNNQPNIPKVTPSNPTSPIERKAPVFDHKTLINSTLNELKTQSIVIWDPSLQAPDNTTPGTNKDPQVNKAISIAKLVYNLLYLPDGNTDCVAKLRVIPGREFRFKQQTTATPAGTNTSLLTIELGDIYLKLNTEDQQLKAKISDELRALARIKSGQAYPQVKGAPAQGTTTIFTYPTRKPSPQEVSDQFDEIVLGLKK